MQSAKMILGHFRHRLRHRKLLPDLRFGIQEMGSFGEFIVRVITKQTSKCVLIFFLLEKLYIKFFRGRCYPSYAMMKSFQNKLLSYTFL